MVPSTYVVQDWHGKSACPADDVVHLILTYARNILVYSVADKYRPSNVCGIPSKTDEDAIPTMTDLEWLQDDHVDSPRQSQEQDNDHMAIQNKAENNDDGLCCGTGDAMATRLGALSSLHSFQGGLNRSMLAVVK